MNEKAKSKNNGIAAWPEDERPRERLLARGAEALTDAELLAIFQALRDGQLTTFISQLDVILDQEERVE